jgi:hypothetical protein
MKEQLEVRVYGIDGSLETFSHEDPEWARHTLADLYPTRLFSQEQFTLGDESSKKMFASSRITRVDLITKNLSVWDFPFLLGALEELGESEYEQEIRIARGEHTIPADITALHLDLYMLDGRHSFLGVQIVEGLPSVRLNRIYSLLKERRVIFGLRTAGVGILNPANVVRFSVCPEPSGQAPIGFVGQGDKNTVLCHFDSESQSTSVQINNL